MILKKICGVLRLERVPYDILIIASLALGLAPFSPEPHLWQKLKMLAAGELVRPLDIFDLVLHASPALLLLVKFRCQDK